MSRLLRVIARLYGNFLSISLLLRSGIMVFILSGALDLSYHVASVFWSGSLDKFMGPDGYYTHLALFAGMVLILIGVIRTKPVRTNPMDPATAARQQYNSKRGVY